MNPLSLDQVLNLLIKIDFIKPIRNYSNHQSNKLNKNMISPTVNFVRPTFPAIQLHLHLYFWYFPVLFPEVMFRFIFYFLQVFHR